ncbi:MAG: LOG family protein [Candidatus Omnitrophica bacterium]|nr:LOG family protein [Candidatus Omnitrophota bacterium]
MTNNIRRVSGKNNAVMRSVSAIVIFVFLLEIEALPLSPWTQMSEEILHIQAAAQYYRKQADIVIADPGSRYFELIREKKVPAIILPSGVFIMERKDYDNDALLVSAMEKALLLDEGGRIDKWPDRSGEIISRNVGKMVREIQEERAMVDSHREKWEPAVVFFGSARIASFHPAYHIAEQFGEAVYEEGWAVRSGGGPSMMMAPLAGYIKARTRAGAARNDKNKTQGINIKGVPAWEDGLNPYVEDGYECANFMNRKLGLYNNSVGIVAFPGGFGTLDEVMEVISRGKSVVLVGKHHWNPIIGAIIEQMEKEGINTEFKYRLLITDSKEEAMTFLKENFNKTGQQPGYGSIEAVNEELRNVTSVVSGWPSGITVSGNASDTGKEYNVLEELASRLGARSVPIRLCTNSPKVAYHVKKGYGKNVLSQVQAVAKLRDENNIPKHLRDLAHVVGVEDHANHRIISAENSSGYVFLPGGPGTISRLMDLLTVMQTSKLPKRPIVLIGKSFWQPIKEAIVMTAQYHSIPLISPTDEDMINVVDSMEGAMAALGFRDEFKNRTPLGVEVLRPKAIPWDKPVAAAFGVHGTLLEPNWQLVYSRVYEGIFGKKPGWEWIKEQVFGKSDVEIAKALAELSGLAVGEVAERIEKEREWVWENDDPKPVPGALELVRKLLKRKVPVFVISRADRRQIIRQLARAGFMNYLSPDNIFSKESMGGTGDFRTECVTGLQEQFPGHTFCYFDDWIESNKEIRENAVCFGITHWEGEQYAYNRADHVRGWTNYLIDGEYDAEAIDRFLTVMPEIQEKKTHVSTADFQAKEMKALVPSRINFRAGSTLLIRVSHDLSTLTYSAINANEERMLAVIPSFNLITPQRYIETQVPEPERSEIVRLLSQRKRYVEYDGVRTSRDRRVDIDAWTVTIDDLFMHKTMKEAGILSDTRTGSVLEVTSGGGFLPLSILSNMPNVKSFSVTDISIYALRAVRRNLHYLRDIRRQIRYYWGKGIKGVKEKADLIVASPPYIPAPQFIKNVKNGPYSGTGLMRELLEWGIAKLEPSNPDAKMVIKVSSLADNEFRGYCDKLGDLIKVRKLGAPLRVPLKIWTISEAWREWLIENCGLEYNKDAGPGEEPYWHTIQLYTVSPGKSAPCALVDADSELSGAVMKSNEFNGSVSRMAGITSCHETRGVPYRIMVPSGIFRRSPDVFRTLRRLKGLDMEIVVFGTNADDEALIDRMNEEEVRRTLGFSDKLRITSVNEKRLVEMARAYGYDPTKALDRAFIMKDLFLAGPGKERQTLVVTDPVSPEKQEETARRLKAESGERLDFEVTKGTDDEKLLYAFADIFSGWFASLRTSRAFIRPVIYLEPTVPVDHEDLVRATRAVWQALRAA